MTSSNEVKFLCVIVINIYLNINVMNIYHKMLIKNKIFHQKIMISGKCYFILNSMCIIFY